ncbi:MAG: hypothetical protein HFJ81_06035 [Clostridia bacterium]|nr:hypothetical protein [Clostridia bacterium]
MKKKIFSLLLLITSLFAFALCSCTVINENRDDDAYKIAVKQFGFEEVWVVSSGTTSSVLMEEMVSRYLIYVLGEKEGREIMIIVPALKKDKSYEVKWPLKYSFKQTIDKYNVLVTEKPCTEEDYKYIEFQDCGFELYEIEESSMDKPFAIKYLNRLIYQSNGEIVVKSI